MAFFDPLYSILVVAAIGLAGSLFAGSWIGTVGCALILVETLIALRGGRYSPFRLAFGWLGRFLDRPDEPGRRGHLREAAGWAILAALALALAGLIGALGAVFQAVRDDPGFVPTLLLLVLIGSGCGLKALGGLWAGARPEGFAVFSGDARQDESPRRYHLRRAAGSVILVASLGGLIALAYVHCYSGSVHEYCEYALIPVIVAALVTAALVLKTLGYLWRALRGTEY